MLSGYSTTFALNPYAAMIGSYRRQKGNHQVRGTQSSFSDSTALALAIGIESTEYAFSVAISDQTYSGETMVSSVAVHLEIGKVVL